MRLRSDFIDPSFRGLRSVILALALVMQWPSAALAQPFLANAIATDRDDKAANAVTAPLSEQLSEARMQLQQAIHSRDGEGDSDPGQHRHALLADKQRLLDWLVDRGRGVLTSVWQQELFTVEDVSELDGRKVSVKYGVTVGKSVGILVVLITGYWLLVRLSGFVQRQLIRRFKLSEQLASVVQRWSMIVLAIALVVFALNLARIPLSVFAFLGGTLAIGVGFGAQTVIKNFICGLIMLFERKVRVGDIVELGGVAGHVTAVDLRATTVLGFNGVEALVPNASFVETQVVNWTHSNRRMRHELRLHIAYGTNVRHAESLSLAAAAEHPGVLDDPAPEAFFESFGDCALTVALVYWVELEDMVAPRRIASDLRHDIYARFDKAGIAIPFSQQDVRLSLAQPVPACAALPRELEAIHAS